MEGIVSGSAITPGMEIQDPGLTVVSAPSRLSHAMDADSAGSIAGQVSSPQGHGARSFQLVLAAMGLSTAPETKADVLSELRAELPEDIQTKDSKLPLPHPKGESSKHEDKRSAGQRFDSARLTASTPAAEASAPNPSPSTIEALPISATTLSMHVTVSPHREMRVAESYPAPSGQAQFQDGKSATLSLDSSISGQAKSATPSSVWPIAAVDRTIGPVQSPVRAQTDSVSGLPERQLHVSQATETLAPLKEEDRSRSLHVSTDDSSEKRTAEASDAPSHPMRNKDMRHEQMRHELTTSAEKILPDAEKSSERSAKTEKTTSDDTMQAKRSLGNAAETLKADSMDPPTPTKPIKMVAAHDVEPNVHTRKAAQSKDATQAVELQASAHPNRESSATQVVGPLDKRELTATPPQTSIKPDPREMFAAMEGESRPSPVWTHAGMNRAEAGFQDPQLGWVGVRARTDAEGVHATVVPSSVEAGKQLGFSMPELQAYVATHHPGQKVTLDLPTQPSNDRAIAQDGAASNQGNSSGNNSRRESQQTADAERHSTSMGPVSTEARRPTESSGIGNPVRGSHISVMA